MADLLYTVGADASNFNQNIQGLAGTAQNASNGVSAALATASQSVDNLGGSALSASMRFQQMRSGLSAMRDGTLAFAVGGQRADMMLMAMGHHITSLVNETGSMAGAFKALGTSLLGPGGVILGLTVAYEIYKKFSEQQKKAAEVQDDFSKSLEEGVKASSTELSHLMLLYQATQNDTLSRQQRLVAVRELQKEYPAYFGNMSKEAILAGDAAGAYDRLTNSIINSAVVKAGQEGLAEQLKPLIALTASLQAEQIKVEESYQRMKSKFKPDTTTAPGSGAGFRTVNPNNVLTHPGVNNSQFIQMQDGDIKTLDNYKKEIQEKIKSNAAAIQELIQQYGVNTLLKHDEVGGKDKNTKVKSELQQLEEQLKKLQSAEDDLIVKGHIPDLMQPTILERSIISLQALIKQVKELNSLLGTQETNKTIQDSIKRIKPGSGDWASDHGFADSDNTDFMPQKDKIGGNLDNKGIISDMQKTAAAFAKHNQEVQRAALLQKRYNTDVKETDRELKSLERTLGEGLNNALQSALSGSENFFKAMGNFIVQLIQQLVAAVIEALILASILSVVSGGTTSVMGELGAVSSFGGGASSGAALLGSFGKHAAGGIFTTPHVGMFGEAGPEAIVTPKHLQEFAGVSGGGGGKDFTVTHKVSGSDMLLLITRANKSKRRTS